ncbi:hypothetical protein AQUCO_02800274v1 [Aquilegia coerulea]|uniref:Cytochrome P450 n=1 Tax=Aquilegia coerulea TaxID=218851 RepID=A0A2G5D5F9_AQUCA|nr:hypothetical protein AQUCO_02800274v1 [Aquilegia coerulea]
MEMFQNHDLAFASRKTNEATGAHFYDKGSMALAQYGPYWRMLRRICTTELFTNNRINGTESLRSNGIDKLTRWLWEEAQKKGSVEVARFIALCTVNIIGNVTLTKDNIVDPELEEGTEFLASFGLATELSGKPNVADFFPFLRWFDPQNVLKNAKLAIAPPINFVSCFVKERLLERQKGQINARKDFLDVMLDFKGNQKNGETDAIMSERNISIVILELFMASTDTTTSTIEWAITELLRHPNIMKNVQMELDQVVGPNKNVKENDIGELPYLQAVVKETLRLHPPVPLLIPRKAVEDTEYMGYSIPKGTQIFVNIWAIGRDPDSWEEPLSFKPERFLSSGIDYKGQHFQYLPFGAGRRSCIGIMLAQRMLYLALGSLIHSFEWAFEDGVTPETIDMKEKFGTSLRKADPLNVVLKLKAENQDRKI